MNWAGDLTLLAFWSPGPGEMLLLALVALLLYGGDLPEVARSWGKMFTEFRRNLSGIQNEINSAIYAEPEPVRKLQYYPEFRHDDPYDAAAASATVVDAATAAATVSDVASSDGASGDVPSVPGATGSGADAATEEAATADTPAGGLGDEHDSEGGQGTTRVG